MIGGSVIWKEADLTFTKYVFFLNNGQYPGIQDSTEQFSKVAADTDPSVVMKVYFISTSIDWGDQPLVPDIRKAASGQHPVEQLDNCSLQLMAAVFQYFIFDATSSF